MTTTDYQKTTTDLGKRVSQVSPLAVEAALRELGVAADKIRAVQALDEELHRSLLELWSSPAESDAEVRRRHREVKILRLKYDDGCRQLLGLQRANRFNERYSKWLNRLMAEQVRRDP